jgi:menaquinone-dependent protoporphyrinogen oxidase
MKILVTHGSERGGTAGIAARMAIALRASGIDADVVPAREVRDLRGYDAVIVGGALYAMRWHADARRFVIRHAAALRERPVWFFSSGPLDDSADKKDIPPTPQVQQLMAFVGAGGHVTFGGRLAPDAPGFIARSMARTHGGDFRNDARIDAWALDVARRIEDELEHPERRAARPAPKPLPSRTLPVALCAFAGVSAFFGGASLMGRPDGSLIGMPLAVLRHSPFHDFFIPGLLLFVVIGLGNLWAAYLHLVRDDFAGLWSFMSGAALVVWMIVEMIMLRSVEPIQLVTFLFGAAIVAESMHQLRMMMPPVSGAPPAHSPG